MPPRPPPSSLALARALRPGLAVSPGRRDNPPGADWIVWTQLGEPGPQPWIERGRFGSRGAALDEVAALPLLRLAPGTAVRVVHEARTVWMGVVTRHGEVVKAPPLPRSRPDFTPTWFDAWEGPQAEGVWMVRHARPLDRCLLTLAACACLREVISLVPPGEDRPLRALEVAGRWAEGETSAVRRLQRVEDAANACAKEAWDRYWDGSTGRARGDREESDRRLYHVAYGTGYGVRSCWERSGAGAAEAAARAVENADSAMILSVPRTPGSSEGMEGRRHVAPLVRSVLAMGAVLLARLQDGA